MKRVTANCLFGMVVLCTCTTLRADWFLDFNGPSPQTGVIWSVPASGTLEHSTDGEVLRVWDTRTPADGGAMYGGTWIPDQAFSDVRISAQMGPAPGAIDSRGGLLARVPSWGNFYWCTVDFAGDTVGVGKSIDDIPIQFGPRLPITGLGESCFLEMDIVGDSPPLITTRVFDQQGGTELFSRTFEDDFIGGSVFTSGPGGTFSAAGSFLAALNIIYDDVGMYSLPIPEPSTLLLAAVGTIALLAMGRRRQKQSV